MSLAQQLFELQTRIDKLEAAFNSIEIMPEFVPVSVAAEMSKRTPQTIRNLYRKGILEGTESTGTLRIEVRTLRAFIGMTTGHRVTRHIQQTFGRRA